MSFSLPTLEGYVFAEKIGSGSYATVYKAYRSTGKREVVAIKCLEKKSLTKAAIDNLLMEIEILKNIKHEFIVELIDFRWDRNYIYLVMEYCAGGDLSKFILARRCLPERVVKRFLQQMATALQYLRTKNISHLDLKPQNVLLSRRDVPLLKLADFGFARYLSEDGKGRSIRGSPLYMAPEILRNRNYDARADLWSIGVILYEALFGRAPFASKTMDELIEKILDSKSIELPREAVNISSSCRDLLSRLLEREPDQRITFDEFFKHPFIDLDHMPSAECLPKATELVTLAVECDRVANLSDALNYYCLAIEYFIPAIEYEENQEKKASLRTKVEEYVNRAEQLKLTFRPRSVSRSLSTTTTDDLLSIYSTSPETVAGIKLCQIAETKEAKDDFYAATTQYEKGLGMLLGILQQETDLKKKELLSDRINYWISRAEAVKNYIEMTKLTERTGSDSFSNKGNGCGVQ